MNRISLRAGALFALAAFLALPLTAAADTTVIRVGVTPGPHALIFDQIASLAAKHGLTVKVVEISDYAVPNAALESGDLEADSFQNQPYLDDQQKARGYHLTSIGKTILLPMGVYSHKVKRLADLKDGAVIGVPNDPTNEARGLKMLQTAGLIKLKEASFTAGLSNISDNPHHFVIRELVAAQLPRSLDDLDAAAINGNYAVAAGLSPARDALRAEGGGVGEALKSPYSNVLVIKTADLNKPWAKQLIAIYHSSAIRGYILRQFNGSIFPAF